MNKNKIITYSNEEGSQTKSKQKMKKKKAKKKQMVERESNGSSNFAEMDYSYVQEPMIELANCTGLLIKQRPDLKEAKDGYEIPNVYHVFGQFGEQYKYLFHCRERSGWCMRNCCPSSSRDFNMEISHITSPKMDPSDHIFAKLIKPFSCYYCCGAELTLALINMNNDKEDGIKLGTVNVLCTLCDPKIEVFDGTDQLKYIAAADGCQCGLICPSMCKGCCFEADFDIINPGDNQKIGAIIRLEPMGDEIGTDADSYQLQFPVQAQATDKLLLLAVTLMIDYQYFETTHISKKRKRRPGHFTVIS